MPCQGGTMHSMWLPFVTPRIVTLHPCTLSPAAVCVCTSPHHRLSLPCLFPPLSPLPVSGALRCLALISDDIDEDQLPVVGDTARGGRESG